MLNLNEGAAAASLSSTAPVILVAAGTSAAALQAVINGAQEGSRIVLQEGAYRFTQTVVVNRDGISLEGQGDVTITAARSLDGAPALQVGAALFQEKSGPALRIAQDVSEGASYLHMSNASTVKVGDVVWIERPNDAALFAEIGDTAWRGDKPLRTGLAIVTEVRGNTLILDRPLPFDFDARTSTVEVTQMVENVTIRNLTFQGDYGTANAGSFTNGIAAEDGGMMISVNASVGTVIQHVDIVQPGSNGLVLGRSLDAVVDDVTVTGAQNKGDGGNGYGLWLRDIYNCVFTNLQVIDTRHAVLFASYTSAVGNAVQVDYTNRDINFHGGLDHGNTVTVDHSVRSGIEQSYMGSISFVNGGTSYGAPTDADANTILFTNVVATVRADAVVATDLGAKISTLAGNDSVIGGAGNDRIDLGTGNDIALASAGNDTVAGGQGTDRLVFDLNRNEAWVVTQNGQTVVLSALGRTVISGIEQLQFNTGVVGVAATDIAPRRTAVDTGWVYLSADTVSDGLVKDLRMSGTDALNALGNDQNNRILGNMGDNIIFGEAGDDRLYGQAGNDVLNGGDGADRLFGGYGCDTLDGGGGNNMLYGRAGADEFVASEGLSTVYDFSFDQNDSLRFDGFSTADLVLALQHHVLGKAAAADDFAITQTVHNSVTTLTIVSGLGDTLALTRVDAADLLDYMLL